MSGTVENPGIKVYHPSTFELDAAFKRGRKLGVDEKMLTLPDTPKRLSYTSSIQMHAIHMYTKKLRGFYDSYFTMVGNFKLALFLIDRNFIVYNSGGEKALLRELKHLGLHLGSDLSEGKTGYNAVNLFRTLFGKSYVSNTCVMIDAGESYVDILKPYVFLAVECHSYVEAYGVQYYLMAIRKEDFSDAHYSVADFTHQFNEALLAKAYNFPPLEFTKAMRDYGGTMQIFTDGDGYITLINDITSQFLDSDTTKIGGHLISDIIPETRAALFSAHSGKNVYMRSIQLKNPAGEKETYYMDAVGISNGGEAISDILFSFREVKAEKRRAGRLVNEGAFFNFDDIIGCNNAEFKRTKEFAQKIAAGNSNIFISGESGTGKELFAQSIHQASARCNQPFVSLNCAAIPKELISSELFGYDEGAFTGAKKTGYPGKFEIADGGTLFLDEIGEMPLDMQSVLLRVIEEQRITRLGSSKSRKIDVRIIAASNRNLLECVKSHTFRADLYYRINVLQLNLIPLRRRKEDIPMLAEHFLHQLAAGFDPPITGISAQAMDMLTEYDWPGNVRELRNIIERAANVASGPVIQACDIMLGGSSDPVGVEKRAKEKFSLYNLNKDMDMYELERIRALLEKHNNKTLVAKELGISRRTLYNKLKKMQADGNDE